jgi:serine/threonine protein phosphatase 1
VTSVRIRGIDHVVLRVADVGRSLRFYRDVLGCTVERQSEADLLWIREPFLSWAGEWGKIVVHGHTVEEAPVTRVNRIGIDTGACWTGKLTCLVLAGTERRFLQTGR